MKVKKLQFECKKVTFRGCTKVVKFVDMQFLEILLNDWKELFVYAFHVHMSNAVTLFSYTVTYLI